MRLVRDPGTLPSGEPKTVQIELTVREPESFKILAQITLHVSIDSGETPGVQTAPVGIPGKVAISASNESPVAGTITAAPTPLQEAIRAWSQYLASRKRKPKSIEAFRQTVTKAARELAWTSPADITFQSVTQWLGGHPDWKGSTYNRNLSAFKSFSQYLVHAKLLPDDPLEHASRSINDGGEGARAATLEEARSIILRAWIRDQNDRRCKGNRALYWLCLFGAGCRLDEPARWKRRHLVLDGPHPHILWTPDINKNRRRQDTAISPELATLLRAHLVQQDRARAWAKADPAGPEDPVFDVVPSKATFAKDRDSAEIKAKDHRGRAFSPHSARKFFSTEMTGRGVPEKMVDRLMRHAGKVEARYYDPGLEEQAAAAAKMPRLWPEQDPRRQDPDFPIVDKSGNLGGDLTPRGVVGHDVPGIRQRTPAKTESVKRSGSPSGPAECQFAGTSGDLERAIEVVLRAAEKGRQDIGGGSSDLPDYEAENRHFGLHNGIRSQNDLADLFLALSRLLRTKEQRP